MDTPTPALRDLARRLLAHEAMSQSAPEPGVSEAVRLVETLRISLTRLAGADGFASLVRRALALARAETAALASVQLTADGRLEGLEVVGPDAAVTLVAHVLGLMTTFIGQPLTLRLVHEAWPTAAPKKSAQKPPPGRGRKKP